MQDDNKDEITAFLEQIPEKFSAICSDTEIDPQEEKEYFRYHKQIKPDNFKLDQVLKESKQLFKKGDDQDKKRLLFLLAHFGNLKCFKQIKRFAEESDVRLKSWAILALEECRMRLESELLEEPRGMIMSGMGGDGHRLRYAVIVSKKEKNNFSGRQKSIVKKSFTEAAEKLSSKLESAEFRNYYALIILLVSMNVALDDVVVQGINACNKSKSFLRFHYYCTNVKKPDQKIIQEYLAELD